MSEIRKFMLVGDVHIGEFSTTEELSMPGVRRNSVEVGVSPFIEGIIQIAKAEGPEFLLIAGDLTSNGSAAEFALCHEKLFAMANSIGIDKKNVHFCLGNHDLDWNVTKITESYTPEILALSNDFYHKVAREVALHVISPSEACIETGPAPLSYIADHDGIMFIVLNSGWKCYSNQRIHHGKIGVEQLEWLKEMLKKYETQNCLKIMLIHHHPVNLPYPTVGHDVSTLEEGSELMELAGRNGISLICHGHRHHPKAKTVIESGWTAPVSIICTGSMGVNAVHRMGGHIPNTIHFVEVSDEVVLRTYEYSVSNGWVPILPVKEVKGIDHVMYLGHIFDQDVQNDEIRAIIEKMGSEIVFQMPRRHELPIALRVLPAKELNIKIKEMAGKECQVFGEYPDQDVCLVKRGPNG